MLRKIVTDKYETKETPEKYIKRFYAMGITTQQLFKAIIDLFNAILLVNAVKR